MDKSRVCIHQAKQLAKKKCAKKTNLLVYEKKPDPCYPGVKRAGYIVPPIAAVPAKKIRVCTGAELRKMCAPKLCDCKPGSKSKKGIFGRFLSLLGFGIKAAIAGGLIYWTYEMGLWGDSEETEEIYLGICQNLSPIFCSSEPRKRKISEVCEAEIELMCRPPNRNADGTCRKAPSTEAAVHGIKEKWNEAVVKTFDIITNLPSYIAAGIQKLSSPKEPSKCDKPPDDQEQKQ